MKFNHLFSVIMKVLKKNHFPIEIEEIFNDLVDVIWQK